MASNNKLNAHKISLAMIFFITLICNYQPRVDIYIETTKA